MSSWGSNDEARRIHSSTADPQSENEKTIETLYEINQVMNLGDRGHLHWLSGRDAKFSAWSDFGGVVIETQGGHVAH